MPTAAEARHGTTFKNGTATFMARILGSTGAAIVQADISLAEYTIYLLDENDPNNETAVANHSAVSLTVSAVIFNALQTADDRWDADKLGGGFNFLFQVVIATNQAFTVRGRRYLVRFKFTPTSGQVFWVEFVMAVV